jgi:hypothetical protein
MNTKLVECLAQIILSLSEEERKLLEFKITNLETSPTVNQSSKQTKYLRFRKSFKTI